MNYEPKKTVPAISIGGGGGDDEGPGSLIENPPKVKFGLDYKWTRGGEVIPPTRRFIPIEILRATQRWINDLPGEGSRVLADDEPFPNVEKLNAEAPQSEWRDYFGKWEGPWQNSYVVYLMDPESFEVITYPAPTAGGKQAVRELRKVIERVWRMCGENVVVSLSDTDFTTKKGGRKRRPHFKIEGRMPPGGKKATPPSLSPPRLEHAEQKELAEPDRPRRTAAPKARRANDDDFDDEIGF